MWLLVVAIVVLLLSFLPFTRLSRAVVEGLLRGYRVGVQFVDDAKGCRRGDVVVHDSRLWRRLLLNPSLGLGEGYVDGSWTTADLEHTLRALLSNDALRDRSGSRWRWIWSAVTNLQSVTRSRKVGEVHYDAGNDLYAAMLDSHMQYSCAWWSSGIGSLEDAQIRKMHVLCEKLQLRSGLHVLDVGCGWGGLLEFMRVEYGVSGTGLTISREQQSYAQARYPQVQIHLQDYRTYCPQHEGEFDRVVSVGAFEHFGRRNYATFFDCIRRTLRDSSSIALVHTIGSNRSGSPGNDWIDKWIFPNAELPSLTEIVQATEGRFVVEDVQNIGPYYADTLRAWHERSMPFLATSDKYDQRFRRMWEFYLVSCRVMFELRHLQLYQVVLTPKGYHDAEGRSGVYPRPVPS